MSALDPNAHYLYTVNGTPVQLSPSVTIVEQGGERVVVAVGAAPIVPPKPGESVPTSFVDEDAGPGGAV